MAGILIILPRRLLTDLQEHISLLHLPVPHPAREAAEAVLVAVAAEAVAAVLEAGRPEAIKCFINE